MRPDRLLPPGQPLSLCLAAGDQLMCTAGLLRLTTVGPWLEQAWAPPAQALPKGQSWRASENLWVMLEGVDQNTRCRLTPAPQATQAPETTDTGGHEPNQHTPASTRRLASCRPAGAA